MTLWYYDQAYWQCVRPWFQFLLSTQYILFGWSSSQKPGMSCDPNHPDKDSPTGVTLFDFDHIWSVDKSLLSNLIKATKMKTYFCLFELLYQYEWEITKSNLGFGDKQIGHWPWSAGSNGQVDPWYHQWIQCNGTTLVLGGLIGFRVVLDQFQAVSAQPGLYWVVVRPYETHY